MRIALIAPPFICVPPKAYGGTELFIAQLATGLKRKGFDVVVYTNGESAVNVETRWLYEEPEWPISCEIYTNLRDISHTAWSVKDAAEECDLIHLNSAPGLCLSRFVEQPVVYTVHHAKEQGLSDYYRLHPDVYYVTISEFQRRLECMPNLRTIRHGIDMSAYSLRETKQPYVSFLGRIAPMKGTHLAIQVAKEAGIPLKIAGEVQPLFRSYFEREVKPHLDGRFIEYVGPADVAAKNELLGNSAAMLFPIQWDEPFGLVMLEAMACGTPVLALPGGSVPEVVRDGVSGYICSGVGDMVSRLRNLALSPALVREYVGRFFSVSRMVSEYAALYLAAAAGSSPPSSIEQVPVNPSVLDSNDEKHTPA